MNQHHPVVVAVDGTERTAGALAYAVAEARARAASLRLVHVTPGYVPMTPMLPLPPPDLMEVGRGILSHSSEVARELAPELEVTTRLSVGSRATQIVDGSADGQLLVVGRAELHGPAALWAGSTAAKICARARCPVVVVPERWQPGKQELRRIVVGVDLRDLDPDQLTSVFAQASHHGATVVAVHSWRVPDPYLDIIEQRTHEADWVDEDRATMVDLLAEVRAVHPDVPVELVVRHGRPAEVLFDAAQRADLLVLVRRRHPMLPHHLGGTARALLRTSPAPVLVLPPVDRREDELVLEEAGAFRPQQLS